MASREEGVYPVYVPASSSDEKTCRNESSRLKSASQRWVVRDDEMVCVTCAALAKSGEGGAGSSTTLVAYGVTSSSSSLRE